MEAEDRELKTDRYFNDFSRDSWIVVFFHLMFEATGKILFILKLIALTVCVSLCAHTHQGVFVDVVISLLPQGL